MQTFSTTGHLGLNTVSPLPTNAVMSKPMSKDIKDLSRDELIARLEKAEANPTIDPNSYAAAFLMAGPDAPAHIIKNVMHPALKVMCVIVIMILLCVFTPLVYIGLFG